MTQTHPKYLLAEGFISLKWIGEENGIGEFIFSNPDELPIKIVSNEFLTKMLLVHKETLEGVSIQELIDEEYITLRGIKEK